MLLTSSVSIKATHCNTKESTACQKLVVCLGKASTQFEYNEEQVVDYKRPLTLVSKVMVNAYGFCLTFRPHRSAARPKMMDPTDRSMSTNVIPHVMSLVVFPNSSAKSSTVKETVKKSNASHDQAKNATRKNIHCCVLSSIRSLKGFGALFMGGFKVDTRVARYRPALMFSSCSWFAMLDGSGSAVCFSLVAIVKSRAAKFPERHSNPAQNLSRQEPDLILSGI